jgi:hypothetical protein
MNSNDKIDLLEHAMKHVFNAQSCDVQTDASWNFSVLSTLNSLDTQQAFLNAKIIKFEKNIWKLAWTSFAAAAAAALIILGAGYYQVQQQHNQGIDAGVYSQMLASIDY